MDLSGPARRKRRLHLLSAAILVGAVSCGNHTVVMQPTPLPGVGFGVTITGVLPASITSSSAPQTIMVAGTNFQNGLKLVVGYGSGNGLTIMSVDPTAVTSTSLQASIVFASTGAYSLVATNPDSSSSGPFMVVVK